jgi:hypothetical protein
MWNVLGVFIGTIKTVFLEMDLRDLMICCDNGGEGKESET